MALFSKKSLMETKNKRLEEERTELLASIEEREAEVRRLNNEVEQLKLNRKIAEEDIKHMVKMQEERRELEFRRKEQDLQQNFDRRLAEEHRKYQSKLEERLHKEIDDVRATADAVLERLPNVNVELTGGIGRQLPGPRDVTGSAE